MIHGRFLTRGGISRPFLNALLRFPGSARPLDVALLVDTGADRTLLAPRDARRLRRRLGIDASTLPKGHPTTGVGGTMDTRVIQVQLTLDGFTTSLPLTVLDPTSPSPIPSLLGRDVIGRFALIVEERTNRVLLLEPPEADALRLP